MVIVALLKGLILKNCFVSKSKNITMEEEAIQIALKVWTFPLLFLILNGDWVRKTLLMRRPQLQERVNSFAGDMSFCKPPENKQKIE